MTGYQSKRLVTNRYADPVTLDHIVDLRKENERLRDLLREVMGMTTEYTVFILIKNALKEQE
jgi:hypothetical protein